MPYKLDQQVEVAIVKRNNKKAIAARLEIRLASNAGKL
jgi:hypothetical protein